MLDLRDCFILMDSVYDENGGTPGGGWECIRASLDASDVYGLGIACYINHACKEAVIALRGTRFDRTDDLRSIMDLCLQNLPASFPPACRFDDGLRRDRVIPSDYRVTYVGHSLGGILATLLACFRKTLAITVDNPGIMPLLDNDPVLKANYEENKGNLYTFLSAPNYVNTLHQHHEGNLYRVYLPHRNSMSASYITECILGSAKRLAAGAAVVLTGGAAAEAGGVVGAVAAATAVVEHPVTNFIVGVLKVVDYKSWLEGQHKIKGFIAACESSEAAMLEDHRVPQKLGKIVSWPKLNLGFPFMMSKRSGIVQQFIPFHESNPGVHQLNVDTENQFLEAAVSSFVGYQVDPLEVEEIGGLARCFERPAHYRRPINEASSEVALVHNEHVVRALVAYAQNSQARCAAVLADANEGEVVMYEPGRFEIAELLELNPDAAAVVQYYDDRIVARRREETSIVLYSERHNVFAEFGGESSNGDGKNSAMIMNTK